MPTHPLPVIQSIPHAGLETPPEVQDLLAIDQVTIYNECDLWNDRIFDFDRPELTGRPAGSQPVVLARVDMPIARVLIDVNRPPEALDNPDGPVKSRTSYGDPIYRRPLTPSEQRRLLETYWRPFHDRLAAALDAHAGQVRLFLDCHNMAQHGPSAYGDPGQPRPLICLANFGDKDGEPIPGRGPVSAPPAFMRQARTIAEELFQDMELLEPGPRRSASPGGVQVVGLNTPFPGGYILRRYTRANDQPDQTGAPAARPTGLMIEVNRGLFVGDQHTRTPIQPPNEERIQAVRERLYTWLHEIIGLLPPAPGGDR